jgi:hypothetical protein
MTNIKIKGKIQETKLIKFLMIKIQILSLINYCNKIVNSKKINFLLY